MNFYYDQFLNDPLTSMTLYAQCGEMGKNGTKLGTSSVWKPIGTSIISMGDSISASLTVNWANGSGNMIDSFMTGIAEGTQQAMQLLGKFQSMTKSIQGVLDKQSEEQAANAENTDFMKKAQDKVYSASSFYPKYDGSDVSLSINPEFIFITTGDKIKIEKKYEYKTALSQAGYMLGYMSPEVTSKVGGKAFGIRAIRETPPNGYFNTQSGISFNNYFGTFGIRIGSFAQFYPLLISSYSINVSTQLVKLDNGSTTPLYVKVNMQMRPAGRFDGSHLYKMITGSDLTIRSHEMPKKGEGALGST